MTLSLLKANSMSQGISIPRQGPLTLLVLLLFFVGNQGFAQEKPIFLADSILVDSNVFRYRILYPIAYSPSKTYPLVIFLHGRGEQGCDNQRQLIHGSSLFLADSNRIRFPAFVVFPQCPVGDYWSNVLIKEDSAGKRSFHFRKKGEATWSMKAVLLLLSQLESRLKPDKNRLYMGGLSMGGMGTLEILARKPRKFAAAFAICGGANPRLAKKISQTPLWLFHGEKDDVVDPQFSKDLFFGIKRQKGLVQLRLYPNANHNAWDSAFHEPNLLPWLFSHRRK